jgi:hypothetical protein
MKLMTMYTLKKCIYTHLFICTLYYHLTHMVLYTHTHTHTYEHEPYVCAWMCVWFFIFFFFSYAVINSDCIPSNGRILMNGELERSFTWYVTQMTFYSFSKKIMQLSLSSTVKCVLVLPVEFFLPAALLPCNLPPFPVHNHGFINHLLSEELCHLIKFPLLVHCHVKTFQ